MRWKRVDNPDLIDIRGRGGGRRSGGLPMGGLARGGGGLGLIGVIIVVALQVLGGGGGGGFEVPRGFDDGLETPAAGPGDAIPAELDPERESRDFSSYVFTDAQGMWSDTFRRSGNRYNRAKLVLFREGVDTACGSATSAVGPFYCPGDERVYLDLSFRKELSQRLDAAGDFAWAYVIAHELGHHVQRQTGTSERVDKLQRDDPSQRNALSIRQELQADCYAGVWAHTVYKEGALEEGDIKEALGAAGAVGDDRLQRRAGGGVNPESFTHGTSEQRERWFAKGYEGGEPGACDTFAGDEV